ncbi:hypothetical protein ACFHWD_04070 [Clostridium sp. MT-14]|uniref:hypothetical protein n=1 Tax=Clostridium sp. MT-14 TaxID=3348360 RepID=UPI0035F2F8D4
MSQQKFIINEDLKISKVDTTSYTNVNAVILEPLPSSIKLSTNGVDGIIQILKNGEEILEISDLDIDSPDSVGKFVCGSTQEIKLIVAKDSITTLTQAKTEYKDTEIYATFREDLDVSQDMYDLTIINSVGEKLFNSNPVTGNQAFAIVDSWTKTLDIKEIGLPTFIIKNITVNKE